MIYVLNYGMGNSASIINMIRRAGGEAVLCSSADEIEYPTAIILPGVGSFDNGMIKLRESGLLEALAIHVLKNNVPFLGVCLGMQLMFERGDEGILPGLGWLKGDVRRFDFSGIPDNKLLKIPHMGWNNINPISDKGLYAGLDKDFRFYFVHSYHAVCSDQVDILATTVYGYEFVSSVHKENIWGVQFHPEKSHRFGILFFRNFLMEIGCV
jgi:glutamine amidotransferase